MFRSHCSECVCLRCHKIVYPTDKIGPLKDFTFFHSGCFRCTECSSKLTLKTYFNNQHSQEDKEVYCSTHVPKIGPGTFDGESIGIKSALNVPKSTFFVNEQIRPGGKTPFDTESNFGKIHESQSSEGHHHWGRFDTSALHIQHALKATELQKKYSKPLENYLDREEQVKLEKLHREEEDKLYQYFLEHRETESKKASNGIQEEWELELEKLTNKFEKELGKKKNKEEYKLLTVRHKKEKEDFEKQMTIKKQKKKESIVKKLLEQERAATAELVDRHSKEMMSLIHEKKKEKYKEMNDEMNEKTEEEGYDEENGSFYPTQPPPPIPPSFEKVEIYRDPHVFSNVDQRAISVAQEDQKTFTDLVRQLIAESTSDVEKARSIFRWITVKNLNFIHFEESERGDTPMGLLRGIKFGTESYHVLFKRLCSYAGLHCVVIKGYSKSAGYQPGISFENNRFRNSWNAVYVAGAWRFVQCNWGARHLVNAKEIPKPGKSDSLRYEYDDHYFLTDPKEFIYEFFPLQPEWQLLRNPIKLDEFEELPFVRSLFFRYRLGFPSDVMKSVMYTDSTGATTIRLEIPKMTEGSLIFHYNLKFYGDDKDNYGGVALKRFVMQSVIDNVVAFRVHAPCSEALLLDIFANSVTPQEYLTGEPMKFKSVCKFKIICEDLQTVMVPLPDCASGEWGPAKAERLFGLKPLSHQEALIFTSSHLELCFEMSRPLTDFMATLHKNGVEEKKLSKYVTSHKNEGKVVRVSVNFPEEGQYGMDIYTREVGNSIGENEKHLLTHCCKYLINYSDNC